MIITFKEIKLALIGLIFCTNCQALGVSSLSFGSSNSNSDAMLNSLNKTYNLLVQWSEHNLKKENELKAFLQKDQKRVQNNSEFLHKDTWDKVKNLNHDSLMLLEASYAFAMQTKSASDYQSSTIRSKAWQECLKEENCSFKKLNSMLDHEALELSNFTKENAITTQKLLLNSINELEEFSNNSKDSQGLNSSLDALSKVNATQANALVSLTNQISNLTKLNALNAQSTIETRQLEQKADELFYDDSIKVKSEHFELALN